MSVEVGKEYGLIGVRDMENGVMNILRHKTFIVDKVTDTFEKKVDGSYHRVVYGHIVGLDDSDIEAVKHFGYDDPTVSWKDWEAHLKPKDEVPDELYVVTYNSHAEMGESYGLDVCVAGIFSSFVDAETEANKYRTSNINNIPFGISTSISLGSYIE